MYFQYPSPIPRPFTTSSSPLLPVELHLTETWVRFTFPVLYLHLLACLLSIFSSVHNEFTSSQLIRFWCALHYRSKVLHMKHPSREHLFCQYRTCRGFFNLFFSFSFSLMLTGLGNCKQNRICELTEMRPLIAYIWHIKRMHRMMDGQDVKSVVCS